MKRGTLFLSSLLIFSIFPTLPGWAEGLMTIEQVIKDSHENVEYIGNDELLKRIEANHKLILLDVRSKQEYDAGHLKGATWLERGVAEFTMARALRDANVEIVVYCKIGNRSGLVAKSLKRLGYKNVKSHVGFDKWVEAGFSFYNFLGEAKMIRLRAINSATNPIEFYEEKK